MLQEKLWICCTNTCSRSATQEQKELGEELLPAAGEVLRVFNELREESTPALIQIIF